MFASQNVSGHQLLLSGTKLGSRSQGCGNLNEKIWKREERKKMFPYWAPKPHSINARERYLGCKQSFNWVSGGLTHRIKVGSISVRSIAAATARRRVTSVLPLVPVAKGVTLAGMEVCLHSKSRGERTGMTSPIKAESLKTPGLPLLSQMLQVRMISAFTVLSTPIFKATVCKLPHCIRNRTPSVFLFVQSRKNQLTFASTSNNYFVALC